MYSQMAKFHPDTLFVIVFFLLALVVVLLALVVLLFAVEFLLSGTPFSDKAVHNIKAVHVLGIAALPLLDLCRHPRKLSIFPPELLHVTSDLFLGAKTQVCSGSYFEIRETDILAVIPLQFTDQGPLCGALELKQLLEVLFKFRDTRGAFEVCSWGPKEKNVYSVRDEKKRITKTYQQGGDPAPLRFSLFPLVLVRTGPHLRSPNIAKRRRSRG